MASYLVTPLLFLGSAFPVPAQIHTPGDWIEDDSPAQIQARLIVLEVTFKSDKAVKGKGLERATPVQVAVAVGPHTLVTSYAGLQGAAKIKALTSGGKITMVVTSRDLGADLALVQPKSVARRSGDSPWEALPLALSDDPLSAEAITLFMDPARPKDAFSIPFADIENEDDALVPSETKRLLGTLPLVSSAGQLVGLWRWSAPGDGPHTASTAGLAGLLKRAGTSGRSLSPSTAKSRSFTFPQLRWKSTAGKGGGARHALTQCRKLRKSFLCHRCHGEGEITEKRAQIKKGVRRDRTIKTVCPDCGGDFMATERERWSAIRTLASVVAAVEPGSEDAGAVLSQLERGIREASDINSDVFREWIRDMAREFLTPRKAVPGRSVAFLVEEGEWPDEDIGDWGVEVHPLMVDGQRVLLLGAHARNVSRESLNAFVTGTIAGTLDWGEDQWVVLEHAWGVPLR